MITDFKNFIDNCILESLHPELQSVVASTNTKQKQKNIANKIKDLTARGEKTGIEGNMPKGSSRAYLKHETPESINLDGKNTKIQTGTKIAINAALDKHHNFAKHDGLGLGALQNEAEHGDAWVNENYRILRHTSGNKFETNKGQGIFPPLIDSDSETHQWSHVGHTDDMKKSDFPKLTKTPEYPKGISHDDFVHVLGRSHSQQTGRYWKRNDDIEKHLDSIQDHPLVEKFMDYHNNTANPPHDYAQIKNMGVFKHPDGSKHIVARDHGYSSAVADAYQAARVRSFK